jgi:hypothetical protein
MMSTAVQPRANFLERHAWKVLLGVSAIIGLFGIGDMVGGASALEQGETVFVQAVTGQSWAELKAASPDAAQLIDNIFRSNGGGLAMLAVLSAAICLTAFRRHERWAWLALWALPGWMALTAAFVYSGIRYPQFGVPVPVISGSILAAVCVLCLAGAYRPFFAKREEHSR